MFLKVMSVLILLAILSLNHPLIGYVTQRIVELEISFSALVVIIAGLVVFVFLRFLFKK